MKVILYYTLEYMKRSTPDFKVDGGCCKIMEDYCRERGFDVCTHYEALGNPPYKPDIVITRTSVSGTDQDYLNLRQFAEDGALVINTGASCELASDKAIYYKKLIRAGIDVPDHMIIDKDFKNIRDTQFSGFVHQNGYPLVSKIGKSSQARSVALIKNEDDAQDYIEKYRSNGTVIFQKYIEARGQDIRVFVLGDKVLLAYCRQAKDGDFRANISCGGTAQFLENCPHDAAVIGLKAAKCLGLEIAGIDVLPYIDSVTGSLNYAVCDVNAAPAIHIQSFTNINVAKAIIDYAYDRFKANTISLNTHQEEPRMNDL